MKQYGRVCKNCGTWWAASIRFFDRCPNCRSKRIDRRHTITTKDGQVISGRTLKLMALGRLPNSQTFEDRVAHLMGFVEEGDDARVSLYRFYDDAGRLLYVGITSRLLSRHGQHDTTQPWADQIASSRIEHYASRHDALLAESWAVKTEKPLYNKQRPEPRGPHPKPITRRDSISRED